MPEHDVTRPVHLPFATQLSDVAMPVKLAQQSSLAVSQVCVPHASVPPEEEPPEPEAPDDDPPLDDPAPEDEPPEVPDDEPPPEEAPPSPSWPPAPELDAPPPGSSSFGSSRSVRPPQPKPTTSNNAAIEIVGRMGTSPR